MGRKVFISFLGTGNYVNCKYQLSSEQISEPVRFIQEALIKGICDTWTKDDKILIFCTEESYKKNWLDNGHVELNKNIDEIERIGLENRLSNTKFKDIVSVYRISEGFTEEEVWSIFSDVYKCLEEGDELYFDVTHAFRSIPMFSTILFNYASYMKGIKVKSIHYGAFEKLGPAYRVKKDIPLENRIAPVLNLTNMLYLQKYTDIASAFTTFGRVRKLSEELKAEDIEVDSVIKDVYSALENFDNAILVNKISDIESGKFMLVINNSQKPIRRQNIPAPIKEIVLRLHKELKTFGFVPKKSYKNIEAAIRWVKHYKMLSQAYTIGQEYIITLVCDKFRKHNPFKNGQGKKFRMFVSAICSIGEEDLATRNYRGDLREYEEVTEKLVHSSLATELRPHFSKLGERRNAVNHGRGDIKYQTLEDEFDNIFNNCLSVLSRYEDID